MNQFRDTKIRRRYTCQPRKPAARLNPTAQALLDAVSQPLTAPDPEASALERVAAHAARLRAEDDHLARRNSDVVRMDDPVGRIDRAELIKSFAESRSESMHRFVSLLVQETADLSSLQDVNSVLRSVIGDSAQMEVGALTKIIENLHELRLIQDFTRHIGLEEKVRDHLLRSYVSREWGPKQQPSQVVVKSPPNSGGRPQPESTNRGLRRAPRPDPEVKPVAQRSRGGGAGPFGNIR